MKILNVKTWLPCRARDVPPTAVVVHATAGASALSSYGWMLQLARNGFKGDDVSYHYIIDRDGTIYKCVPASRVAFHAGKSVGPSGLSVNDYSLGIAFANMNNGEPITKDQERSLMWLIRTLKAAMPSLEYVTTHRDIAPKRKTDPVGWSAHRAGHLLKPWTEERP